MESEQTTSRARRRGNKREPKQQKEDDSGIGIELDLTPSFKISHLSLDNLQDAHGSTDLSDYLFFLNDAFSELQALKKDKYYKASLAIYDKETNQIEAISLDSTQASCLSLWNCVAFLYFDKAMSERFSFVGKNFKDCLMYADLRPAFNEKSPTRGVVIFTPVLRNPDAIMRRAVIVDEVGVFLLGGTKINPNAKKNPIGYSNQCSYYEIEALDSIGTSSLDGQMDSMDQKRDDLIVCQNQEKLFVTGRNNWNPDKGVPTENLVIEIFEKEEMTWISKFTLKYDPNMMSYSTLSVLGPKKQILMLLVGFRRGKASSCYVIDTEKTPKSKDEESKEQTYVKELEKVYDANKENMLILTGYETFQLQNCYPEQERLLLRNFKKENPELEEYDIFTK